VAWRGSVVGFIDSESNHPIGDAIMLRSVISKVLGRFVRDERGATMLEYGLLVGLIAILAIAAIGVFGGGLSALFTDSDAEFSKV